MYKKLAFLSLILIFLTITILSLLPPESGLEIKKDKLGHFLAYTFFSFNVFLFTLNWRKRALFSILIVLYSGGIEILQGLIPGRVPSFADLLANSSGVVMGLFLFAVLGRSFQNKIY